MIHPTADTVCGLAGGRRERLWVGTVRDDILAMVGLVLFLKDAWYLDGEVEGWAPRWVEER